MYLDLLCVLQKAAVDTTVVGVLITGSGKYFSAGADLKEMQEKLANLGEGETLQSAWTRPVGLFMAAVINFPKVC